MDVSLLREELSGIHLEEVVRGGAPAGIPKMEICELCHSDAELLDVVIETGSAFYECTSYECLHVQRRPVR